MMSRRTEGAGKEELKSAILRLANEHPEFGQAKVAQELKRRGYSVSPSGVRYIWQKHDLETTYKRLKAIATSKKKGSEVALTSNQRNMLRRGDISRKLVRNSARSVEEGALAVERRSAILSVAAQLFGERGYDGTSIRDIAASVGLLPGSVYHHFPSKQDILVSVHHEGFRQLIETAEEAIGHGSDPWERLELVCAVHIEALVAGNPISMVTGASQFSRFDIRLQRRLRADRDRYEEIVRRLIADLDFPDGEDRSLMRLVLLGALNWTLVWYRPAGRRTPREIAHHLVGILRGQRVLAESSGAAVGNGAKRLVKSGEK